MAICVFYYLPLSDDQ